MDSIMTKATLLDTMRTTRAEWETWIAQIDRGRMTQPGVVGAWAIKDVIFHCTRYAQVFVRALEAALRGEPPPPEVTDRTPLDERNQLHFQQSQQRALDDVLGEAQEVFRRLIELTEAHPEAFLVDPQTFAGVPESVVVWKNLQHVCNHYRDHMQSIRVGLAERPFSAS
jgi:uncharacterized damage-inducible protein DinB